MNYLFTSESVSEGHPDKVADQISDAILDQFLALDPDSHVACETMVTTVYLVRHGETDYNLGPRYQGQLDIPLNDNGRRQGDLLGQAMKNHHIDEIFSSPLSRAFETGELIAKYHDSQRV